MITRRLLEAPDNRGWIFLAIILGAAVIVPLLHLVVPPSSMFYVSTSSMTLWGKYLCYALLALSLVANDRGTCILSLAARFARVLQSRCPSL